MILVGYTHLWCTISGVVMGGATGRPPRAALLRGGKLRVIKKLCCVREIK